MSVEGKSMGNSMWPLKGTKAAKLADDEAKRDAEIKMEAARRREAIAEMRNGNLKLLQDWRPIGGTFRYLDVDFIVTGYRAVCPSYVASARSLYANYPSLTIRADYKNPMGMICQEVFEGDRAKALMAVCP